MNMSTMKVKLWLVLAIPAIASAFPTPVFAYVGPGAALSLLGALWGMIVAIGAAVAFAAAWPVRRYLRQRRQRRADSGSVDRSSTTGVERARPHPAAEM